MMQRVAKVHIWVPELFYGKGGIQNFSRNLLAALSSEISAQEIRVLLKNDLPKDVRIANGFRQVAAFGHWPLRLRTARFAWECLRHSYLERPQLILSTHLNFGPLAHIIHRFLHVRYVLVAYGVEAWDLGRRPDLQKCLHHADKIFAISSYTRNRLLDIHGLQEDRVVLLPSTFDAHVFDIAPKPTYLLKRYGLGQNQRIILTVSRLAASERKKGYDQVLRSVTRIRCEIPDIHYIIVGQGDDRPRIEALITDLDLQGYVTLAGDVPDRELSDHYNLCDVFAMPSKQEGFGIVFLEALACGKPVLGGNKDGSVDPLCNGELGALVDPDNLEEIVQTLLQLLKGTYSNPIVYKPEMLRQKVIDIYGFQEFSRIFAGHLKELLCLRVAPDVA
jgi:glycosyltransferase involved in cell wall biosynthesis